MRIPHIKSIFTYRSTNSSSNKTVLYLIMIGFLIANHLRLKSRQLFESQFIWSLNGSKQLLYVYQGIGIVISTDVL